MAQFGRKPSRTPQKVEGVREIGGSYACMVCRKRVKGAKYVPQDSTLIYACEDGHTNVIEDFGLDLV